MNRMTMALSLGLATLAMFGCSSSTSDNTDAGHTTTFNDFYTGVIQQYKCLNCHVPGGPGVEQGNLDMSTQALAYANLVKQKAKGKACESSGLIRVIPNDPEHSLILLKTELAYTTKEATAGTIAAPIPAPCGSEMPLGCSSSAKPGELSCLGPDDIKTLTDWINSGAPGPQ